MAVFKGTGGIMSEALKERNLSDLVNVPDGFRDEVLKRFFQAAEVAQLDPPARDAYEQSLKYYRDMKNVIDTAVDEGKETLRKELKLVLKEERRQKEDALRQKEDALRQKEEAFRQKEEALKRLQNLKRKLKSPV